MHFRALTAAMLLLLSSPFLSAFAQNLTVRNLKIRDITFQGLNNTSSFEVQNIMEIRTGDRYSDEKLNLALKKIYSLDMFRSAMYDVQELSNGVNIVFTVEENPYIRSIRVEGASSVRREDLDKEILFTPGSYFTRGKLLKSIANLEKKYKDEGYINAIINYKLEIIDVKKNVFDLKLLIQENRKVVVEKIIFTGNKELTASEIKGVMKTKEQVFIIVPGVLKEEEFSQDRDMILAYYQHKGFLDAQVNRFEWKIEELGDDKHKAIVVYADVTEGTRYKAGTLKLTGNTLFTKEELMPLVDFQTNQFYDQQKMEMARYAIRNKYADTGHLYANVSLVKNKRTEGTNELIDSELVITEGPLAHVESVTVSGNTKTQSKVIKRELIFDEGELYIESKIRASQNKLMQLQYFSDVKVNYFPGSAEGLINLDIYAEDQRTGMVTFGLTYGTENGFGTTAQLAEKNLFGTGRSASLKFDYGQVKQSIELSYQEPWLFEKPISANVSLGFSKYQYTVPTDRNNDHIIDGTNVNYVDNPSADITIYDKSYYYEDTLTIAGGIARSMWVYWMFSGGIATTVYRQTLDAYDLQGLFINGGYGATRFRPYVDLVNPLVKSDTWKVNEDLTNALLKGYRFKNSLSLSLGMNSTDHGLSPMSGSKFSLSAYYFGGLLAGETHFIRPTISFDNYINPLWKLVWVQHASAEFILPQFGNTRPLYNTTDPLKFDGTYEMRGWTGLASRGESKLYLSTELRFPLIDPVWGAVFFDIGNLWDTYDGISPLNPEGYLFSFGLGIQVNMPMLPIRIYMARMGSYNSTRQNWDLYGNQNFFDYWQPVISIQGLF